MRHLLLIHADERAWEALSGEERQAIFAGVRPFRDELVAGCKLLGGDQLRPTWAATTVRVRDGETLVTDGPYAETKEQLGGYWLVDCEPDEALEIASRIAPRAVAGGVEVRACAEDGEEAP